MTENKNKLIEDFAKRKELNSEKEIKPFSDLDIKINEETLVSKVYILIDEYTDDRANGYLDFVAISNNLNDLEEYINTNVGFNLAIFSAESYKSTHWSELDLVCRQVGAEWIYPDEVKE